LYCLQLVLAYPLVVLLLRCPLILSSRWLVVAPPLVAPPTHAFVVPPSRLPSCQLVLLHILLLSSRCANLSSCHHAGWLLRCLLLHHPLVLLLRHPLILSSCQLIVASPLVVLLMCRPLVLSLRRLVVALPLLAPPSCLLLCHPLTSTEYQLNLCRLVVVMPLVTLPSYLLSRCTASRRAAHLPSRCTSWLLHCLSSSSRCAAPLVISSRQLVVASPLLVLLLCRPPVVLPHQLGLASPLVFLLLRRPLVLSSRWLVVALPLDAPPTCLLVAPPYHPLSTPADRRITSCHPLVALPSRPLIAPAGCCVLSPCVTLLSSHRAGSLLSYLSLRHLLILSLCRPLTALAGCCVASIKR
jgi:hypothetical protein